MSGYIELVTTMDGKRIAVLSGAPGTYTVSNARGSLTVHETYAEASAAYLRIARHSAAIASARRKLDSGVAFAGAPGVPA